MPELGEIKRGNEVGYPTRAKYIWSACKQCGRERWVHMVRGKPLKLRCFPCFRKANPHLRGEKAYGYKGGRHKTSGGYVQVLIQHDDFLSPMVKSNGYILEHRIVMARHLGRCLEMWELVHHKNHIRDDNRVENLQLVSEGKHRQITVLEQRIKYLEDLLANEKRKSSNEVLS